MLQHLGLCFVKAAYYTDVLTTIEYNYYDRVLNNLPKASELRKLIDQNPLKVLV